jgi:hypothetical protein
MTIKGGIPLSWFPKSLTNALDSTPIFPGAMSQLANLIPDPSSKNIWQCRPASQVVASFGGIGGQFSSAFSNAFDIGIGTASSFISCLMVVGNRAYGMIASSQYPGFDVPFSFNLVTGLLDTITGVTSSNIPTSPTTTGAWVPPTADVIGTKLIVTHPGFNTTNGYFGWIDITNPAAPAWSSGNTSVNALVAVPVAVKQFNGRAWYVVNPTTGQPGVYYSDALNPTVVTNGTQILTFFDNIPITALGQLPLNNQLGGIIQALIVFKGVSNMYQVTGDATTSNLTVNALNVATGTLAPNSICTTPKGLAFMATDGVRILDFNAHVSDPIGISGSGMTMPFTYAVVPSRVAAACNLSIIRISVQNGNAAGNPNQEYWYDMARDLWHGPHTFPASLIQPYTNTFIMAPLGVLSKLFQSDAVQSSTSTFVENGTQLSFISQTSMLPNSGKIAENYISETTIDLGLVTGATYSVSATDMQGNVLDAVSLVSKSSTASIWGSFTWGAATWGSGTSKIAPRQVYWTLPIVTDQWQIQVNGLSSQGVRLGKIYMRYSVLGYLEDAA